jgi:hypothetical protein
VPKVPKKSDFFGKIGFLKSCQSDFSNRTQSAQEIRFFGKIGFLKSCQSDFSNRAQSAQEIRFFGKIGFLKSCQSDFSNRANRISQTVPKLPKKSDFFGKIGFLGYPPKAIHMTGVCHSFDARNLGFG